MQHSEATHSDNFTDNKSKRVFFFFLEHFLPPSAKTCCCAEFILQPVSVLDVSSYKADNVLLALQTGAAAIKRK